MTEHPFRDFFLALLGLATLVLAGVAIFHALRGMDNVARWVIGLF